MKPYKISPAGLDTNVGATTQYWTAAVSADSAAEPFVQEFEGSFHMRDKKTEDPTNILYMLYPNGESGQYPYPAEHEPYSRRIRRVDNPIPAVTSTQAVSATPANSTENEVRAPSRRGGRTPATSQKTKRTYVRRTKAADATAPNQAESSSSSSAAVSSTSQTQESQRTVTIRRNRLPAQLQDGCIDPACLNI